MASAQTLRDPTIPQAPSPTRYGAGHGAGGGWGCGGRRDTGGVWELQSANAAMLWRGGRKGGRGRRGRERGMDGGRGGGRKGRGKEEKEERREGEERERDRQTNP